MTDGDVPLHFFSFSQHKVPEFQDSAPPSCEFSRHANPVDYFMDLVTPEVSTSQVDLFVQKYRHWVETCFGTCFGAAA